MCADMEQNTITLLSILMNGDSREQKHILEKVKKDYFEEDALSQIFSAASILSAQGKRIDMLTIRETLITDDSPEMLSKRLDLFRKYFVGEGDLDKFASDDDVKRHISILLASICASMSYTTPVEIVTQIFLSDYVRRAKKDLMISFQHKLDANPAITFTDEMAMAMRSLDNLLKDDSWKNYVIDFSALENEAEDTALILRKGQGVFFRGNLYLISGYAGSMKSFLCLAIAAAATNKGLGAEKTLSFCSTTESLKILYADTELARNTVKKRWKSLKMMSGEHFDPSRFQYLSLRMVSGTIDAKLSVFDNACRSFKPDLVIIDSGRDLCLDFNDNRESDRLVSHFKQIAADLNAVVISTSHKSLGNKNPKGHFGMRMNEASGLEMSLEKATDGQETYVKVDFPKQREDSYEPFAIKFDEETGWLTEYAPTVDRSEESRQEKFAKAAITQVLPNGRTARYNDLVRLISTLVKGPNGKPVSERTAKNYISVAHGKWLVCDENNQYSLAEPKIGEPITDDLPE